MENLKFKENLFLELIFKIKGASWQAQDDSCQINIEFTPPGQARLTNTEFEEAFKNHHLSRTFAEHRRLAEIEPSDWPRSKECLPNALIEGTVTVLLEVFNCLNHLLSLKDLNNSFNAVNKNIVPLNEFYTAPGDTPPIIDYGLIYPADQMSRAITTTRKAIIEYCYQLGFITYIPIKNIYLPTVRGCSVFAYISSIMSLVACRDIAISYDGNQQFSITRNEDLVRDSLLVIMLRNDDKEEVTLSYSLNSLTGKLKNKLFTNYGIDHLFDSDWKEKYIDDTSKTAQNALYELRNKIWSDYTGFNANYIVDAFIVDSSHFNRILESAPTCVEDASLRSVIIQRARAGAYKLLNSSPLMVENEQGTWIKDKNGLTNGYSFINKETKSVFYIMAGNEFANTIPSVVIDYEQKDFNPYDDCPELISLRNRIPGQYYRFEIKGKRLEFIESPSQTDFIKGTCWFANGMPFDEWFIIEVPINRMTESIRKVSLVRSTIIA